MSVAVGPERRLTVRRLRPPSLGTWSAVWLAVLLFCAILLPIGLSTGPDALSNDVLAHPSINHLFGTDEYGRDVFVRALYGARASLLVATIAITIGLVTGATLGIFAAIGSRLGEEVIMRSMDVVLSFPAILLGLLVAIALGSGLGSVAVIIAIVISPHFARLFHARVSAEMKQGYVDAERSTGASVQRILGYHVLRNLAAPVGAYSLLLFADAMLFEAALSFLGVGIQPPRASWGNMILEGQSLLPAGAWWVSVLPGLVLFITVAALNDVAERWLTRVDPQLRRRTI